MKTRFILFFTLAFIGLMSTSCKKDKDTTLEPDPPASSESYFDCKIDGAAFHTEGALNAYAFVFEESFNVYGVPDIDAEDAVYLQLPKGFETGTHAFNEEFFASVVMGGKTLATLVADGNGSITIDSFDGERIKGTFTFSAVDYDDHSHKMVITNGKFDVAAL